jgi:hypothetical protein
MLQIQNMPQTDRSCTYSIVYYREISLGRICENVYIKSDGGIYCLRLANNILRHIYMF